MRLAAIVGLVSLGVGAGLISATPAGATTVDQVAWYWKMQQPPPATVPAPPWVPEDGFMVQGAPDGPSAIGALRVSLDAGHTNPILTLPLADGSSGMTDAVIVACPVVTPWGSGGAQLWSEAPTDDCPAASINGQVAEDGSAVTFPVGPLLRDTTLDLVLRPGTVEGGPDGTTGSTFTAVFEAPTAEMVKTTTPASAPSAPSGPASLPASAPSAPAVAPASPPSFSSPVAPPSAVAAAVAPPTVAVPPRPSPSSSVSSGRTVTPSLPVASANVDPLRSGRDRWLAVLLVGVGAVLILVAWRNPQRVLATLPLGGLGRYARAREGNPPPLT